VAGGCQLCYVDRTGGQQLNVCVLTEKYIAASISM
jgi:hypothetical protein